LTSRLAGPGRIAPEAREQTLSMLHAGTPAQDERSATAVREEIVASWRRSIEHGVRLEVLDAPYDAQAGAGDLLSPAAGPVADAIAEDLDGTSVSLLLTDGEACIVDRRVPDRHLLSDLDRMSLAPGFRYSEDRVGTNAVAVALHEADSAVVTGGEHFADRLTAMACAATPVTDPATGQVLGAVSLACRLKDASPLMLPFVRRAGREIEQRLADDRSAVNRVLLEQFLGARRRVKGPLIAVNDRTMYSNSAAAAIVRHADRGVLWEWASRVMAGGNTAGAQLRLASGQRVAIRARPVEDGDVVAGALVRLDPVAPDADPSPERPRPDPAGTGWASLTGAERSVAAVIADGATNRQAAARLFLSRHTIDFHLRQIFRKLGIASRVELARVVAERGTTGGPGLPGQSIAELPKLRTYVVSRHPGVAQAANGRQLSVYHLC
jgi:DNA-binding CsgD family transcriptional regulator